MIRRDGVTRRACWRLRVSKMLRQHAAAVLAGIAFCVSTAHAVLHVNTTTSMFVDETGRERYFHGVNVVYKAVRRQWQQRSPLSHIVHILQFPWHPQLDEWNPSMSFVKQDMEYLQRWGLNGVRLGTSIRCWCAFVRILDSTCRRHVAWS